MPETHHGLDELNSTEILGGNTLNMTRKVLKKRPRNIQIRIRFSFESSSILPIWEMKNQFKEVLWIGINRDDEFLVFKGKKSLSKIKNEGMTSRVGQTNPQAMNNYNSSVKLGFQIQAHQKINKRTYQKLHQIIPFTSILNSSGTLTENWISKSIRKQINT